MNRSKSIFLHIVFILTVLIIWQGVGSKSESVRFFFGSPYLVLQAFWATPSEWFLNTTITGTEAIIGFILGVGVGSVIGFCLLYSQRIANFTQPYIIALGSIPIFAVAPMLIIWFGIGYPMKVVSAFLATVLVALSQAYEGGKNIDDGLVEWFKMYRSSNFALFRKLILPSSLNWVFASLKMNIGFSLLGAFLGEFIASDSGLGHEILKAGGLYQFPRVFAATICIIFLALALNNLVSLIEDHRYQIIEFLTVPRVLRGRNRRD